MKEGICIGLAQIPVVPANIEKNLEYHIKAAKTAATHNADVIVFPELSLTGYELEAATRLALNEDAQAFQVLSDISVKHNIVIVAGCPLQQKNKQKPTIAAVICFPSGKVDFYAKQFLHSGEELYFSTGDSDYQFTINDVQIALAICADFATLTHSFNAKQAGADIYLVSALISNNGFDADAKILANIAKRQKFPVLLSNHIVETGGWSACGNNGVWDATGELINSSMSTAPCVLLCTFHQNNIRTNTV